MNPNGHVVHGGFLNGVKSREYMAWRNMKSRCYTTSATNYRFYGGRGITICDRWRTDFAAFREDMGPCPDGHSIDRVDPRGNYEPANCRWATAALQHANTRRTLPLVSSGLKVTLSEIAAREGVCYSALHKRISYRNETIEQAVLHLKQHQRGPRSTPRSPGSSSTSRRTP